MVDAKQAGTKASPKGPEKDLFLTVLYAPDRDSLAGLLRKELLDVGPMLRKPDAKEVEVHLYADEEQIKRLREYGWRLEVRENLSEVGRKRQKEVGKGDRFKGGKIPPKGLGKKIGKEG
jgi:hypothetical protein